MGVKVCLEGFSPESDKMVEGLKAIRTKIFDQEITRLQSGKLKQAPHIQWFHVEKRFFPMGVKMIGGGRVALGVTVGGGGTNGEVGVEEGICEVRDMLSLGVIRNPLDEHYRNAQFIVQ